MGKYNIKALKEEKHLKIELIGLMTEEDGKNFIADFFEAHEGINPSEYKLSLNVGRCELYPIEVERDLKDFFLLYKQNNYETVTLEVYRAQKELVYQLKRLAHKVGLNTLEFKIIN